MKVHRNLSSSQEALAERNLFAAVTSLRSTEECRAFFRDLCTPAELQAMADRWAVVDWLVRGVPYREINRLTGVSVTTISRVARCLADGNGGYSLVVRRTKGPRRNDSARRQEAARHG
jgi:TrpR-related protein YerC/YecD